MNLQHLKGPCWSCNLHRGAQAGTGCWQELQPVGHQHWNGLFPKEYTPLRGSVLGQHVEGESVGNDKVK